jgi:hypothetical protein
MSNLFPNLRHLSCISGQALYIELEKGKLLGTRRRTRENQVKKPFLSILRSNPSRLQNIPTNHGQHLLQQLAHGSNP